MKETTVKPYDIAKKARHQLAFAITAQPAQPDPNYLLIRRDDIDGVVESLDWLVKALDPKNQIIPDRTIEAPKFENQANQVEEEEPPQHIKDAADMAKTVLLEAPDASVRHLARAFLKALGVED